MAGNADTIAVPEPDDPELFEFLKGCDPLVDRGGIADVFGVRPLTVDRWRKGEGVGDNGAFPEPDAWAGASPRWQLSTVLTWARAPGMMYSLMLGGPAKGAADMARRIRALARAAEAGGSIGILIERVEAPPGQLQFKLSWPKALGMTPELLALRLGIRESREFAQSCEKMIVTNRRVRH